MKKLLKLAFAAGIPVYLSDVVYRYAFGRQTPLLIRGAEKLRPDHYRDRKLHALRMEAASRVLALPHETLTAYSSRSVRVRGNLWPAADTPSGTVAFIVHGLRSSGVETAAPYVGYYHSRGIDVFACDHEAAGQSEGRSYSYGYHESLSCLRWLDLLIQRYGKDVKIILHGSSMGAATVLQMADCCPPQVRFLVSDCAFTSAKDILTRQAGGFRPAYSLLRGVSRLRAGFDTDKADCRPHVLRADRPALFVHGTEDQIIPFSMTEELYSLYAAEKDFLRAEGARHAESIFYCRQAYEEKLDQLLHLYC